MAPSSTSVGSVVKFMFPRLAIGGCRYVRGLIHAEDVCDEFESRSPRANTSP